MTTREAIASKNNFQDLVKTKQMKLLTKGGVLDMKPPPTDPRVQKEFSDALVNLSVECGISFSALSGPAFCQVINVLNKHSREKVTVPSRFTLAAQVTKSSQ